MEELFEAWPAALEVSGRIADRCTFDITTDLDYRFPDYVTPDGSTADV
jgi:DNA polymerase III alpha subunit